MKPASYRVAIVNPLPMRTVQAARASQGWPFDLGNEVDAVIEAERVRSPSQVVEALRRRAGLPPMGRGDARYRAALREATLALVALARSAAPGCWYTERAPLFR
jgi:hypothetical protein